MVSNTWIYPSGKSISAPTHAKIWITQMCACMQCHAQGCPLGWLGWAASVQLGSPIGLVLLPGPSAQSFRPVLPPGPSTHIF